MCSSRKYPCPPQERFTEIPRGRGVSKALFFEGKYDTKMEFPRGEGGGGFKLKNLPWEGYGYFLEQHNQIKATQSTNAIAKSRLKYNSTGL